MVKKNNRDMDKRCKEDIRLNKIREEKRPEKPHLLSLGKHYESLNHEIATEENCERKSIKSVVQFILRLFPFILNY